MTLQLRAGSLSGATLQGLHSILQHIWQYDYPACMQVLLINSKQSACFNVLLFAGDCWLDSRRLLCRDVRLHARGENASASGTAAGRSRFGKIVWFQSDLTPFVPGSLCGVPTVESSGFFGAKKFHHHGTPMMGKNIYFTISVCWVQL